MNDLIDRQAAIDALSKEVRLVDGYYVENDEVIDKDDAIEAIRLLPSVQPEYEPVKAEDFAKTMSENTLYGFMAWHGEALELMERQGFVICKKI